MKIIFVGTSSFALPSIDRLIADGHEIVLCVTQPDRPKGRGKKLQTSPVKDAAVKYGIPVFQPLKIAVPEAVSEIKSFGDIDALVVASYGQKIPKELLEHPTLGPINVHGSLLPRYRGAAPIQYSLLMGDKVTGVTTMFMAEGLDTGDILLQSETEINSEETAGELFDRLADIGAELLSNTLKGLETKTLYPTPQDNSKATIARSLAPDAGKLDFTNSAEDNINIYRGCTPAPGAYTFFEGTKLKIQQAKLLKNTQGAHGTIAAITKEGIIISCGEGAMLITQLQPESKKRMAATDFARGKRLKIGDRLG